MASLMRLFVPKKVTIDFFGQKFWYVLQRLNWKFVDVLCGV